MEECRELPLLFYAYRRRLVGNVSAHSHGGCELIYLLRGSCRVEGPLGVLAGRSGQLLVIPPETVHNQIDSPDEKNIFCVFQAQPGLFEQRWRTIDLAGEAWCRRWLLELSSMTERNDFEGANAILLGLLLRLSAFEKNARQPNTCIPGSEKRWPLSTTISRAASQWNKSPKRAESAFRCCGSFSSITAELRRYAICRTCGFHGRRRC